MIPRLSQFFRHPHCLKINIIERVNINKNDRRAIYFLFAATTISLIGNQLTLCRRRHRPPTGITP
jgi:hypothetical protein